jgi:stearoyl-CoA desaturase (delta-9 desaturase)
VHSLAVSAFFLPVKAWYLPAALALFLAVGLGTTVGLHRLCSHRAFACPLWVEYALVTAASLTGQGSPLLWVATHRRHHANSDQPGDVHSPRRSFWYSHLGWILDDASTEREAWKSLCPDIAASRYYHWLIRYRLLPQALAVLAIGLMAGWAAVPFLFYLPAVLWMHATYSINSVCHLRRAGTQPYDTRDDSTNVWWVGLLVLGEGWHNNHHAFPKSAFHGLSRWQLDLSGGFIRLLQRLGLAWDVHAVSPEQQERRAAHPTEGALR